MSPEQLQRLVGEYVLALEEHRVLLRTAEARIAELERQHPGDSPVDLDAIRQQGEAALRGTVS